MADIGNVLRGIARTVGPLFPSYYPTLERIQGMRLQEEEAARARELADLQLQALKDEQERQKTPILLPGMSQVSPMQGSSAALAAAPVGGAAAMPQLTNAILGRQATVADLPALQSISAIQGQDIENQFNLLRTAQTRQQVQNEQRTREYLANTPWEKVTAHGLARHGASPDMLMRYAQQQFGDNIQLRQQFLDEARLKFQKAQYAEQRIDAIEPRWRENFVRKNQTLETMVGVQRMQEMLGGRGISGGSTLEMIQNAQGMVQSGQIQMSPQEQLELQKWSDRLAAEEMEAELKAIPQLINEYRKAFGVTGFDDPSVKAAVYYSIASYLPDPSEYELLVANAERQGIILDENAAQKAWKKVLQEFPDFGEYAPLPSLTPGVTREDISAGGGFRGEGAALETALAGSASGGAPPSTATPDSSVDWSEVFRMLANAPAEGGTAIGSLFGLGSEAGQDSLPENSVEDTKQALKVIRR